MAQKPRSWPVKPRTPSELEILMAKEAKTAAAAELRYAVSNAHNAGITPGRIAELLQTSRTQVYRLLDPSHKSR